MVMSWSRRLTRAIKTYAVLRDEEADAIAFWILHTWLVVRLLSRRAWR